MNGAFQMKYCMGPNSAIFHLRIFWLGFEPGSHCWEAGALSITPQAHAQVLFKTSIYKKQMSHICS